MNNQNNKVIITIGENLNQLNIQFTNISIQDYQFQMSLLFYSSTRNCLPNLSNYELVNKQYKDHTTIQPSTVVIGSSLTTLFSLSFAFFPQWILSIVFAIL